MQILEKIEKCDIIGVETIEQLSAASRRKKGILLSRTVRESA